MRRTSLLGLLLAVSSCCGMGQTASPVSEQTLLKLANQDRAQHGLAPLRWDNALAQAARAHLAWMIRTPGDEGQELLHQYPGEENLQTRAARAGARFSTVSENLAAHGENPLRLEQKWMSTTVHRENLLNPELNIVGVAVAQVDGLLYAVEDFGRYVPVESHDDLARRISQLLQARGIAPAGSTEATEAARRTCEMPKGAAGSPKLVVQWDGPDPTVLPDALLQQLASGRFTSAAVGVCAGQQGGQFTTYHVAVLLF